MGEVLNSSRELAINVLNNISPKYWHKMHKYIKENDIEPSRLTGFLLNPEEIAVSIGKTHIAIEYYGKEKLEKINDNFQVSLEVNDYSKEEDINLFEKVIGIEFDSTTDFVLPLATFNEDLILPTTKGFKKLSELGWNFAAQQSFVTGMNCRYCVPEGQFTRFINCTFFDANESGLITRRAKWIDFIPVSIDENSHEDTDVFSINLNYYSENWLNDLNYEFPIPQGFKYEKLAQVNKFIEVSGSKEHSEPQITSFLSQPENKFILMKSFFAKDIFPQVNCEWQSEERDDIKPDFFVVKPNGYADIVEFKLPYLKGTTVVGKANREQFSAELNSYIAQTRVYNQYFNDPNNRKWVEEKYGFKVYNPRRYLVVGRRFDFDTDIWQEIKSEYPNLEIITYDDLVDGVIAQFYC